MAYRLKRKIYTQDGDLTIHFDKCCRYNLVFKNTGNVEVYGTPASRKVVFKNSGNVIVHYGGPRKNAKHFVYDNDGDVNVYGFPIIKTKHEFKNRGNVIIHDKPKLNSHNIIFKNKGSVSIDVKKLENVTIENSGDFITSAKHIDCDIKNSGNAYFPICDFISPNISFSNHRVEFYSDNPLILHRGVRFVNSGDLHIKNVVSLSERPEIACRGDVVIGGIRRLHYITRREEPYVISSGGNVEFTDVDTIDFSRLTFANKGDVRLNKLTKLDSKVYFKNLGDVYMNSLVNFDTNFSVFENTRNLYLKSFKYNGNDKSAKIKCIGNVYVKNSDPSVIEIIDCGGYIFTESKAIYPSASYLKRYDIEINDGYVILYKAVNFEYKSFYDCSQQIWKPNTKVIIPNWNPYEKEYGEGKFVASYSPKSCNIIGNKHTNKIVALKVNVFDLFEWLAFPKYPQIIAFNKAEVLYECDSDGKLIKTEYE